MNEPLSETPVPETMTPVGPARSPRPRGRSPRRLAREFALKGLYQALLNAAPALTLVKGFEEAQDTQGWERADQALCRSILEGTLAQKSALEQDMAPHLDRPVTELSPIERAVLTMAAFELTHHREVPYRVVINEAIELTKLYGGTDGHRFVNGVLDKLASALRPEEARQGRAPDPA